MTRSRASIIAELTEARARVYELEAELATSEPERCRLALVGPCDGDELASERACASWVQQNPEASW